MYRSTKNQGELFLSGFQLSPRVWKKLQKTWAYHFRVRIMPMLLRLEGHFAKLYHQDQGRPNWSVARMLGLCLLQEWFDLTDEELENQLGFDVRFAYALELKVEEAYLSRRSFTDFRLRLSQEDPEGKLLRMVFDEVTEAGIKALGLKISKQRLDSTHVMSNIQKRGFNALFSQTLQHFAGQLGEEASGKVEQLPAGMRGWLAEEAEWNWFGKGGPQVKRQTLAEWAVAVTNQLAEDPQVVGWESYQLVKQLVDDYCEVGSEPEKPDKAKEAKGGKAGDAPKARKAGETRSKRGKDEPDDQGSVGGSAAGENSGGSSSPVGSGADQGAAGCSEAQETPVASQTQVEVLTKGRRGGYSLQSPFDPDAGYGHKGVGYSVQIAETCGNKGKPEIITDYELQSAADNDWGKSTAVLTRLDERRRLPQELYADAGYPTPQAILDAQQMGTSLHAPVSRTLKSADALGREAFTFDADGRVLGCPAGHTPLRHGRRRMPGCSEPELHAFFDGNQCRCCPYKDRCVARGHRKGPWWVRIEPRLVARDLAFQHQQDRTWWKDYSIRSGIEGTNSELKRIHGLGRLRVRRRVRVLMRVSLKLTACNIKRWLKGAMEPIPPSAHLENAAPIPRVSRRAHVLPGTATTSPQNAPGPSNPHFAVAATPAACGWQFQVPRSLAVFRQGG